MRLGLCRGEGKRLLCQQNRTTSLLTSRGTTTSSASILRRRPRFGTLLVALLIIQEAAVTEAAVIVRRHGNSNSIGDKKGVAIKIIAADDRHGVELLYRIKEDTRYRLKFHT